MRSYWLRVGPIPNDWCPYKRREVWKDTQKEERSSNEDRSRDWSDVATSQEALRISGNHQRLERGKE